MRSDNNDDDDYDFNDNDDDNDDNDDKEELNWLVCCEEWSNLTASLRCGFVALQSKIFSFNFPSIFFSIFLLVFL